MKTFTTQPAVYFHGMLSLCACNTNTAKPVGSPTSTKATVSQIPTVFPTYLYQNGNALSHRDGPTYRSSQCNPDSHGYPYQRHPSIPAPPRFGCLRQRCYRSGWNYFQSGRSFTKPGDSGNNGSTTWTTSYSLVYLRGGLMGSVQAVQLPAEVPSGKTVDLSVSFTAPAAAAQ